MSNLMIPEAAVEAAVAAVQQETYGADWSRRIAKIALEAAAPHLAGRARVDFAVEAVLISHQRQSSSSCLCGWAELGKSHPGHQAAMLAADGLLRQ